MNDASLATARAALAPREDTTAALAAQVKATVEARFIMAMERPRDRDMARDRILAECKRPKFAESARYRRPVGMKKNDATGGWEEAFIEGPSIRFAEAAMMAMGNIDARTMTTFDSLEKRTIQVSVTDLESNTTYSKDITVLKVVERKKLKNGQVPLSTRLNTYNETVYILPASEGEVATKEAAEISKAVRTLGLRLIPGDILDEAMDLCVKTAADSTAKDPDAARKAVVDAFSSLGVKPADLKQYLGQDVGSCSPTQTGELRELYTAIKAGEFAWSDVIAPAPEASDDSAHGATGIKDQIKKRAATRAAAKAAAGKAAVIDAEGEDVDAETGEVAGAAPAQEEPEAQPDEGTGELSEEEERRMAAEQAANQGGGQ